MKMDPKLSFFTFTVVMTGVCLTAQPLAAYAQRSSGTPNYQGGAGTRGQGPGRGPVSEQGPGSPARMMDEMRGRSLETVSETRELSPGLGAAENMQEETGLTPLEQRLKLAREGVSNEGRQGGQKGNRVGRFFGDLFGHEGKPREGTPVEMGGQAWEYQPADQGPGRWERAAAQGQRTADGNSSMPSPQAPYAD